MPEKLRFEPQDNLTGQDFSFRKNKDMAATQANETFAMDARFNRSLGANGETLGFAKRQFSNDQQLQEARDMACEGRLNDYGTLSNKKIVKAWLNDQRTLDGVEGIVAGKREALEGKIKEVAALRAVEAPDPSLIEAGEKEVAQLSKDLAAMQHLKDNKEQEQRRLVKVYNETPVIQQYMESKRAYQAADTLVRSIGGIAESSAWLFEAQEEMKQNADLGGDRQLLTRAVASHEVDKFLGLNVCAEEKFAVSAEHGVMGVSIQCAGAGVRSQHGKTVYGEDQVAFLDIDYADARVQKGLHDLAALDYITGQTDRHVGNIFVDPESGKVTGIDNDLAFPEIDREEMLARAGDVLADKAISGMPRMMDAGTAERLLQVDPGKLRNQLESIKAPNSTEGLSDREISGTVNRLMELQGAITLAKNGGGGLELVANFNQDTYDRAANVDALDAPLTSYIMAVERQRDVTQKELAKNSPQYCMRGPEDVDAVKINHEYAAYKQMRPDEQANYRDMQAGVDKLEASLKAVRKDMANLEHPGMKDRIAALKHGGVDGARQHLLAKEGQIVKDLDLRMKGLRLMTAPYVVPMQEAEAQAKARKQEVAERKAMLAQNPYLAEQAPTPPAYLNQQAPTLPAPPQALPATAEQEQDVTDPVDLDDDLEADVKVEAEEKKEGLAKKPSVAEMLKRSQSNPALGGHRQGQGLGQSAAGQEEPKPTGNSLRASGSWQATKPSVPKPVGSSISASQH